MLSKSLQLFWYKYIENTSHFKLKLISNTLANFTFLSTTKKKFEIYIKRKQIIELFIIKFAFYMQPILNVRFFFRMVRYSLRIKSAFKKIKSRN